ncbi:CTP:molybdopterin cytidylyltransferase MocA [Maridesulfovibrio ferrireducens]|uniref:CTP:molybdopterin cytidylyltransferase MocA n=1 Tax=Maridesulfovibrio ferrireducens TaxID=246191 RepID=A0A1G9BD55_9BACT|nr:NTP transferase domain-containing protein [Maridesulfovibrio ferrireducens]SDK37417.1 CTP:molybdopterin cytidylyltransferase MocA [Maridesulfovibrio ferrireducens]
MKIYGLVLAAGLSSRMGKLKATLPLDEGTVLSNCIRSLLDGGVADVFVVTGHKAEEVESEVHKLGMHTVYNPDYENGMFSSVIAGVKALPDDVSAFLVLPVDIPLVRSSTVRALTFEFKDSPADIIYPAFKNERGHPPLISAKLIPEILLHDGTGGLRKVLERHDSGARNKNMPDLGILHDLDTPEDYTTALKFSRNKRFPLPEECESLWELAETPQTTQEHCKAVAKAACTMAKALNSARREGPLLDMDIVQSAALMHDVAKIRRNHEAKGGTLLAGYGFTGISDIVASHRDTKIDPTSPLTEKEIVFLADKLFEGSTLVTIKERYGKRISKWANDPDALKAIHGRLERAENLLTRYENEAGIKTSELLTSPAHSPLNSATFMQENNIKAQL